MNVARAEIQAGCERGQHTRSSKLVGRWTANAVLLAVALGISAATASPLFAAEWPKWWKKKPDVVTASCTLDRSQVEQRSTVLLRAKVDATESRGHPLSYVWTGNGGKISGVGPQVEIDASGLNPGVYSAMATARDQYNNSASCTVTFQVMPRRDKIQVACTAEPSVVEQGKAAIVTAQGTDALSHALQYRWFTNGGTLRGEGSQVELDTADILPGVYTITGRAEDNWGLASDCVTTVKVEIPPPPPVPPQPARIAEIVFPRNQDKLEQKFETQLEGVLSRLRTDPAARLSIEAYAGPDEKNPQELAAERAQAVKRYLVQNGVAESRIQTLVGLGGGRGGLRNRTLDIIWLPKDLEY